MYEPSIAQHRPSCFHNLIAPLSDLSPMPIPVLRLQLPRVRLCLFLLASPTIAL